MMRPESSKELEPCRALGRASSSFIPVRSIEFLIARVRSSTVSVPAGPRSDFVLIAMVSRARPMHLPGYLRVLRHHCPLILTGPDRGPPPAADRTATKVIWGGSPYIPAGNGGRRGRRVGPDLEAWPGFAGTGGVRRRAARAPRRGAAVEGTSRRPRHRDRSPVAARRAPPDFRWTPRSLPRRRGPERQRDRDLGPRRIDEDVPGPVHPPEEPGRGAPRRLRDRRGEPRLDLADDAAPGPRQGGRLPRRHRAPADRTGGGRGHPRLAPRPQGVPRPAVSAGAVRPARDRHDGRPRLDGAPRGRPERAVPLLPLPAIDGRDDVRDRERGARGRRDLA